jgi:high-affinity Fe2+/Pb2+ permease
MWKERLVDFLKVYAVFILFALLVNLSMEILIPTAEEKQVTGIIMFYLIFSFLGSLIYLLKNYRPVKMGLLSLLIGFILEFAMMRPEWVLNIYNSNITGDVIGAVLVTSLYWFIAWGIPSYALHRFIFKAKT